MAQTALGQQDEQEAEVLGAALDSARCTGSQPDTLRCAMQGMKVGVMRQIINPATADGQFTALFSQALQDLAAAGVLRSAYAVWTVLSCPAAQMQTASAPCLSSEVREQVPGLTETGAATSRQSSGRQLSRCSAGATISDNFTIQGNSLGAMNWDGRLDEWYTGFGLNGHWEDIECDRFRYDIDNYLATAHSAYKDINVRLCLCALVHRASVIACSTGAELSGHLAGQLPRRQHS